jgi:hypothetical protein
LVEAGGRPQAKVYEALAALQFIEEGILSERDFVGLNKTQAAAVISEARKAKSRREHAAAMEERNAREAAAKKAAAICGMPPSPSKARPDVETRSVPLGACLIPRTPLAASSAG